MARPNKMPLARTESSIPNITRRHLLGTVAGSSMILGAGCMGGDDGDDGGGNNNETSSDGGDGSGNNNETSGDGGDGGGNNNETSSDGGGGTEGDFPPFRYIETGDDLTQGELNGVNPRHEYQWGGWFLSSVYAINPLLGREGWWSPDYERIELNTEENYWDWQIAEGVKWHQGGEIVDDYTAEDMLLHWKIETHPALTGVEYPQFESVEVRDEKTFRFNLAPDEYNGEQLNIRPPFDDIFGGYTYRNGEIADLFEALEDSTTEDEETAAAQEIIDYSIPVTTESIISGPWMIEDAHPQEISMKRVPGHPLTENPEYENNWNRATILQGPNSESTQYQGTAANDYDMGGEPPANVTPEDVPDNISIPVSMDHQSRSLMLNYSAGVPDFLVVEEDEVAPIEVAKFRQAIAYALDIRDIFQNNEGQLVEGMVQTTEKYHVGSPVMLEEHYPDLLDALPDYGEESRPDMAEQRLSEAGLTKEDGRWLSPSGEPVTLPVQTWESDQGFITTAASQLSNIGLETDIQFMESTDFVNRLVEGAIPFTPSYSRIGDRTPDVAAGRELDSIYTSWPWYQYNPPQEYEIPAIGDLEGEPTEVVNGNELSKAVSSSNMTDHEEIGKKTIWANAYHLPKISLYREINPVVLNNTRFETPGDQQGVFQVTEDHPKQMSLGVPEVWAYAKGIPGQRAKTD